MQWCRAGMTRDVFLVGGVAIKVPTLRHGSRQFVLGMLANLNERATSIAARGDRRLAATWWCAPFGLLAVQERVGPPVPGRILSPAEAAAFPFRDHCGMPGVQAHNLGTRADGLLVCFDYGAAGEWSTC
jgi:hypothetical protein